MADWKCAQCGKPVKDCPGHPTSEPKSRRVTVKEPKKG